MFSREYLDRLAAETTFRLDTLEKVLRLERLLNQVRRHPFLGDRLALKGGTALNLFFGGPVPRLSVDLDFNYVRPVERDEMLREKPEVERAIRIIAEGDGYRLQWGREEHAGRKIYLWYRSALGPDDHIEVDLNFLHRVPLVPPVERDGWTPDPDHPCRALVVGTEEMLKGSPRSVPGASRAAGSLLRASRRLRSCWRSSSTTASLASTRAIASRRVCSVGGGLMIERGRSGSSVPAPMLVMDLTDPRVGA